MKGIQAMIIVHVEEWLFVKQTLQEILGLLKTTPFSKPRTEVNSPYVTAKEFMTAVRICRSNFDKLVNRERL